MDDREARTPGRRADVIQDFARSELFERTFQEGMELVEETASYLDGSGRQESRGLSRGAAMAYAAESMGLTTRLMQVASWLLVQRAVREGDLTPDAACEDRYRIGRFTSRDSQADGHDLPNGLLGLVVRSERLYERVRRLDERMYLTSAADEDLNPVMTQFDRIRSAFAGGR